MVVDNDEAWAGARSRRFFRSGELHLVLLALIGERPQHGYELMADLTARFGPGYRASPGSIYPALTALEAEGLWEKTVVIVAADHGEELFEHGWIGHNVQLYEPSVRVPLVVRFPSGTGPRGVRVGELVDLLDLAPTIADVFGVLGKGGSDKAFQGRSLLPVALGAPGKPMALSRTVWDRPRYGLRDGRYALTLDTRTATSPRGLPARRSEPGDACNTNGGLVPTDI